MRDLRVFEHPGVKSNPVLSHAKKAYNLQKAKKSILYLVLGEEALLMKPRRLPPALYMKEMFGIFIKTLRK